MAATSSAMAPQGAPGPIYVDTQHEDLVHDAQLDYYGCKLATCSSGKRNWRLLSSPRSLFHSDHGFLTTLAQ